MVLGTPWWGPWLCGYRWLPQDLGQVVGHGEMCHLPSQYRACGPSAGRLRADSP